MTGPAELLSAPFVKSVVSERSFKLTVIVISKGSCFQLPSIYSIYLVHTSYYFLLKLICNHSPVKLISHKVYATNAFRYPVKR